MEQWDVGVQNDVKKNDWIDLLVHRMYLSDYQIIQLHLIVTTAALKILKMLNIAPTFELSHQQEKGTPIRVYLQ